MCLLAKKVNYYLASMTDNLPPNLETHGWVHPIRWPMCRYYSWPCLLLLFVLYAGYGKRRPLQIWGGIWFGLSFVINPIWRWSEWTITNKMTLVGAGVTVSKIQSNVNWVACRVSPLTQYEGVELLLEFYTALLLLPFPLQSQVIVDIWQLEPPAD